MPSAGCAGIEQVEKLFRGLALGLQRPAHGAVGLHQYPDSEGNVGIAAEALDGLGPALFSEREIALLQAGDQNSLLVADCHGKYDLIGLVLEDGLDIVG